MDMQRFRPGLLGAAVLAVALPSLAAVEEFKIDPAHSSVGFQIRHIFSKVPGSFGKFSGSISYDPSDLSTAVVKAEIDAASIDTNNEGRDKHLKSPDFFEVEKYPTLSFESTGASVKGKDAVTLKGNLTMHGVTRPVELQVTSLGSMSDPRGGKVAGFEARATVQRKEFGIIFNKVLDGGMSMLGDDVEILINVEAKQKRPDAPAPAGATPADGAKPAAEPAKTK